MRKLNLFDIPKYAITIITLITLISPCVAWECPEMPPFFPHLYTQSSYAFSAFKQVELSDHGDPCESEIFRPIYKLHDVLLDTSFSPPIETIIEEDSTTCNNGKVYVNKTDDTMLAIPNAEIQLSTGKIVPTSPLNIRKRLHYSITNNELTYNKSKIQLDEASDIIKQLRSENQALMNIKTSDNDDIKKLMERTRTLEQSNGRLQHDANKLQHVEAIVFASCLALVCKRLCFWRSCVSSCVIREDPFGVL
uniref:Uncharacterized protein n=1 Tax=Strongyloides stercoralis TaxID=6248 RepID=A0A0K0EH08_STRER